MNLIGYLDDTMDFVDEEQGLNFECFLPLASQVHVAITSVSGSVAMMLDCRGTGEPL